MQPNDGFIDVSKVISYYNTPVIKQVPPLRQQIIQNIEDDVNNGKYKFKDIARFQSIIDKKQQLYQTKLIDPKVFKQMRRDLKIYENPHFRDIYKAMQIGREELAWNVSTQTKVILDTKPMIFENLNEYPQSNITWLLLQQMILSKVSSVG